MSHGWTNRAPVRERCPERTRSLWGALAGLVIAALPWGVWLAQHNECLSLIYDVDALRSQQEELKEIERRVRVELAGGQRLGDIESWAELEHGLIRPEPARVVILPTLVEQAADLVARSDIGTTLRKTDDDTQHIRPTNAEVQ